MPDIVWEVEFRRRRFAQLRAAYDQSSDRVDEEQVEQHRAVERPKVIAFLDAYTADVEALLLNYSKRLLDERTP